MEGGRGSGGGGCCIARYTQGSNIPNYSYNQIYYPSSNNNVYDMSKMDRIMLRFRPIAPKPVAGGAGPTSSPAQNDLGKTSNSKGGKRRNKCSNNNSNRNSNNNGGNSNGNKRRKSKSPEEEQKGHVVTLPLLPETPDLSPRKDQGRPKTSYPIWLSFGPSDQDQTGVVAPEVVGSSVVVEGVTDTWLDGNGLGRSDEERRRRLMEDTCPGFVSDGWERVVWTNEAYRRMVVGEERERSRKVVVVKLEVKDKVELPKGKMFPAFTCKVSVQYGGCSMTVPCDVWRMDCGGFAWRLDLNAALSLGR